jgi:hypothetical protein
VHERPKPDALDQTPDAKPATLFGLEDGPGCPGLPDATTHCCLEVDRPSIAAARIPSIPEQRTSAGLDRRCRASADGCVGRRRFSTGGPDRPGEHLVTGRRVIAGWLIR